MPIRRVAAALGVVLAIGVTTIPAAPATEGPSEPPPSEAELLERYRAFAQEHSQPIDVAGGGGSTSPFCYGGELLVDTLEGGSLDIERYAIAYLCSSGSTWAAFSQYSDNSSSGLGDLSVLIDRDRDAATGCAGVDTVVYVTRNATTTGLQGVVFHLPSCSEGTWVPTGIPNVDVLSGDVYVFFPASSIGGDRHFRWKQVLADAASCETTCDYDTAPDVGWSEVALPCAPEATAFKKVTARSVSGVYDAVVGGDFDGDADDDLFFYGRGTAADGLLQGSGSGLLTVGYRPPANGAYDEVVSGDFDGDGADDLFFYGEGARPDGYLLATPGSFALSPVPAPVQVTRVYDGVAAGDFDRDGLDDLFFYGEGSAPDGLLRGTANGLRAVSGSPQVHGTYHDVAGGDVNGDGFGDVAFYGLGAAPEGLLRGTPTGLVSATPGSATGVYASMAPGDFNGDDHDDLFFYAPGRDCEGLLHGYTTGPMGGIPTPGVDGTYDALASGDFDRDGHDDVFFYGRGSAPEGQLLGQ